MTTSKVSKILSMLMNNMSEASLANAVDIPKATIHRVLSGDTPDPRAGTLLPIAQYFGITIEQLMGVVELPDNSPLKLVKSFETFKMPFIPFEKLILWANEKYHPNTFFDIALFTHQTIDENCFVTQILSDEMAPIFPNKTYLIVKKTSNINSHDITLAVDNEINKTLIGKYIELNGGQYLLPANSIYGIEEIKTSILIIGTVIEGRIVI